MDDAQQSITDERVKNSGHNSKVLSAKEALNSAFSAIILDENVREVNKNSLRVLSNCRSTVVRSTQKLFSEVIAVIETHFVLGKWNSTSNEGTSPDGCKLVLQLEEDHFGCEVRPFNSRCVLNFDYTGRFRCLSAGKNDKKNYAQGVQRSMQQRNQRETTHNQ